MPLTGQELHFADQIDGLLDRVGKIENRMGLGWRHPIPPNPCRWYKDVGNESYTFFTSCGAQIDYDRDWWSHCPNCGYLIARPSENGTC